MKLMKPMRKRIKKTKIKDTLYFLRSKSKKAIYLLKVIFKIGDEDDDDDDDSTKQHVSKN